MKHYTDIFVSPIKVDFTKVSVSDAPRGFYADWFELVVKITKAIHPQFEVPAFPETVEFKADKYEINPITDVYYFIDANTFIVRGTGNYAVQITAYEGFQQFDGDDYIEMKSAGLPLDYPNGKYLSSTLKLKSVESLASFSVDAEPQFLAEADKIFAELQNL
jgi:hypothetical protein